MDYNLARQTFTIAIRISGICITMVGLFWLLYASDKFALSALVFFLLALQFWSLVKKLTLTDREIIQFLDAVNFSDFSVKIGRKGRGRKESQLAESFDLALEKFKKIRATNEKESRYLHALIDHVPVALLSIKDSGEAHLLNNAAKRLFNLSHIREISDLNNFGPSLDYELHHLRSGKKRLIHITQNGVDKKVSLSSTKVIIGGNTRFLVSLQNIQSELDTTQIEAWQDLVHVLTHELMNSLTPVASLSNSMNTLVQDMNNVVQHETLSQDFKEMLLDLTDGLEAISRRSERLESFVTNYRKMTKVPPPDYQQVSIEALFNNMAQLFEETCNKRQITFETTITPRSLSLNADPRLIDQVLVNLIKNALDIVDNISSPLITLKALLDQAGNTIIEVSDNGPGIDEAACQRIFVPFYTTKPDGSGIGLSLSRQIMLAHHGSISCHSNPDSGASFKLIFKN